jgi:DeoR family fructose operon transcriptional repressor
MVRNASKTNVRHDQLIDYIARAGEATVQALAGCFQVSIMTIRRDLMQLEAEGRVIRTHGGAILSKPGVVEFSFAERNERYAAEKRAIAREVARMIKPGQTLALDSGTTTLEVAKAIMGIEGVTVLTCSLAIASVLYSQETVELVLLGGTPRRGTPDLIGWLTEQNLRQFHVDFAVVGADGLTADGAYTMSVDATRVCQAVLAVGQTTILVTDHSKFGKPSFSRYAALKDFDHIITDADAPPEARQWLNRQAADVIYVER